jgi:hypothetical protein
MSRTDQIGWWNETTTPQAAVPAPARPRVPGGWRGWVGLAAGLALIVVVIGLPPPERPAAGSGPAAVAGPPTLASVWPAARPFTMAATFPDGSTYNPVVVLDAGTSVGFSTSADALHSALVVASGATNRVLQTQLVSDGGSFDGITATADRLFWMHTADDGTGHAKVSLWGAPRSPGPARQITADVGRPVFYGSQHDMQVVDGRLYWVAARPGPGDQTELRSIALAGGPVTTRVVGGSWAMSSWPWLITAPGASGTPMQLYNLITDARTVARVPASKQVYCSPVWCRMIPGNVANGTEVDVIRPDGSDRRRIGDPNATAIASDVALRDRFEVLLTTVSSNAVTTVSRLTLYDITHRRGVLIEPAATNAGARGDFLWWSTGDGETLAWHGLDLRTLP